MLPEKHECPKCGALCSRSGQIRIGQRDAGLYECPTCRQDLIIDGRSYLCELVFAVDEEGLVFHPETQKLIE